LLVSHHIQRRITLTLKAASGIPIGFTMANE
jgi:hypothetical protein